MEDETPSWLRQAEEAVISPHGSQRISPTPTHPSNGPPAAPAAAASLLGGLASEGELMHLAKRQAARDAQSERDRAEIAELHEGVRRAEGAAAAARDALREAEAALRAERLAARRDGVDLAYLKNVTIEFIAADAQASEALFPALATCLQFNEADVDRIQRARDDHASLRGKASRVLGLTPRRNGGGSGGGGGFGDAYLLTRAQAAARAAEVGAAAAIAELPLLEARLHAALAAAAGVPLSPTVRAAAEPKQRAAAAEAAAEVGFAAREVAALRERCAAAAAEAAALRGERETREAQALYLRSVLVNAFETCMGFESIFPVLSFALKFTPEEVSRIVAERKRRSKEGGFVAVDAVG